MSMKFNTIILVDDEPAHATLVERNLRRVGFNKNIVKLERGQEVLDLIFGLGGYEHLPPPDFPLILLDLNMPGKSGMDVLKEIKSNAETSHIPIIVLTTSDDPAEIEQCYQLGCNAYIIKPVLPDEFREKMGELGQFLNLVSMPCYSAILQVDTKLDDKEGDE